MVEPPDKIYLRPEQAGKSRGMLRRPSTLFDRWDTEPEGLVDDFDEPVVVGEYKLVRVFTIERKSSYDTNDVPRRD